MTPEQAETYFINQVIKWGKIFGVPIYRIKRENRMWYSACVKKYYRKNYVWYNSKWLADWGYECLIHIIFHELGHLKNFIPYTKSKSRKVKSEYLAEKFALKMLKKYYPKKYKKRLKQLPKKLISIKKNYSKDRQFYYDAFKLLPEYQGTIK